MLPVSGAEQLRHSDASGFLPELGGDVRVVEVAEALAGLGVGQEEVPQAVGLGLRLHAVEQLELAGREAPAVGPALAERGRTRR